MRRRQVYQLYNQPFAIKSHELLMKRFFSRCSNPTPDDLDVVWNSVKSEGIQYLSIRGPDDLEMTSEFYNKRLDFWDDLNLDDREILPDSDFLKHDEL